MFRITKNSTHQADLQAPEVRSIIMTARIVADQMQACHSGHDDF